MNNENNMFYVVENYLNTFWNYLYLCLSAFWKALQLFFNYIFWGILYTLFKCI